MWRRIYSQFLRLLLEYTTTPDFVNACMNGASFSTSFSEVGAMLNLTV